MEKSNELTRPNLEKENKKIYKVADFNELDDIRMVGDSEKVEMGDCLLIEKNENVVSYSYGAGPCISGILQTNDNKLYMFHSVADNLTQEQKEIVKNTKKGFIGGGKKTLEIFRSEFANKNIKMVFPPEENYDFNIVFVKDKNQFEVSPGIYFCYDSTEIIN